MDIEPLLRRVTRPARYTGGEWNAWPRPWEEASVRVLLAYPDVYEVGMACPLVNSLYHLLNALPGVTCHRTFAPWPDMETAMREAHVPLWGLEERKPMADYQAIVFVLASELSLPAVLNMLDLGGVGLRRRERTGQPLVVACGPAALNPAPWEEVADLVALGDPEAVIPSLVQALAGGRHGVSKVPGVYMCGQGEGATVVWASPLPPPPSRPLVPFVETVRDGLELELVRGDGHAPCARYSSRYWGPHRQRPPLEVVEAAARLLANTGYRELFLSGLSYDHIHELCPALRQVVAPEVNIRLLQVRPQVAWVEAATVLAGGRPRGGLTIWVGPASRRARLALGLPDGEAELMAAVEAAFARGWSQVRLQVEVGMPGEDEEDMSHLAYLAKEARALAKARHGGRAQLRVEASPFVPRPFTPLQWAPMPSLEELAQRLGRLRKLCRRAGVEVVSERPERAVVAALVARGDHRTGEVALRAWRLGARLDTRRELFAWAPWEQGLREMGLEARDIARGLDEAAPLPWDKVNAAVDKEKLRQGWQRLRAALGLQG
jgi:hypothetical protein